MKGPQTKGKKNENKKDIKLQKTKLTQIQHKN
jgi:hypothetical protein